MELKEFVKLDADQVRRDKELMQLFVNFYEAAFSFIPNCVGCSFKSGFKKLKKYANKSDKNIKFDKTITIMESKTFLLKKQYLLKILNYKKYSETKKKDVVYRSYGHAITEDFAKELVEFGNTEVFAKLPQSESQSVKDLKLDKVPYKHVIEVNEEGQISDKFVNQSSSKYDDMHHQKELLPLYSEVKERTGKKADSNKKADIIAFLVENEA